MIDEAISGGAGRRGFARICSNWGAIDRGGREEHFGEIFKNFWKYAAELFDFKERQFRNDSEN